MGGRSGKARAGAGSGVRAAVRGHAIALPGAWEDFGRLALDLPFTSPTGYGLARGGWVTAEFAKDEAPPVELLCQWIDESYREVAPKRLVKESDASWAESRR